LIFTGLSVALGGALDRGVRSSDIPLVVKEPVGYGFFITLFWLAFAIGRWRWRRANKDVLEPDPASLPGPSLVLPATMAAAFSFGLSLLKRDAPGAGAIDTVYACSVQAALLASLITQIFFIPRPARCWSRFFRVFGTGFLSAAAVYALLVAFNPARALEALTSIDKLGASLSAIVESYAPHRPQAPETLSIGEAQILA
jgi:hypothetical protein